MKKILLILASMVFVGGIAMADNFGPCGSSKKAAKAKASVCDVKGTCKAEACEVKCAKEKAACKVKEAKCDIKKAKCEVSEACEKGQEKSKKWWKFWGDK